VRYGREIEIALVFAVSVIGLGANQLVLHLGVGQLSAEMQLAKQFTTGSVFLRNYSMRNHFVVRQSSGQRAVEAGLMARFVFFVS